MAIARVSAQDNTSLTATFTYPLATTAGNLLICAINFVGTAVLSTGAISGWTKIAEQGYGAAGASGTVAIFAKISTGDTGGTATASGTVSYRIAAFEYTGAAKPTLATETNNGANSGASSVSTQQTGNITTVNAGDLVFVLAGTEASHTTESWATATALTDPSTVILVGQYLPGTTLTNFHDTATWGTPRLSAAVIAAFIPSTAVTDGDTETLAEGTEAVAATLSDGDTAAASDAESAAAAVPDDDTAAVAEATEVITVSVSDGESSAITDAATLAGATGDDDTGVAVEAESISAAVPDSDAITMTEGEQADAFSPVSDDDTAAVAEATESIVVTVINGDMIASAEAEAIILAITDGEGGAVSDGESEEITPVSADIVVRANLIENPAGIRLAHARVTFSVSYTALGEPLIASDFGLRYITFAAVMELDSGYAVQWADGKLHVRDTTTGLEVAGGTDLSGLEVDVAAWQLEGPTWRA